MAFRWSKWKLLSGSIFNCINVPKYVKKLLSDNLFNYIKVFRICPTSESHLFDQCVLNIISILWNGMLMHEIQSQIDETPSSNFFLAFYFKITTKWARRMVANLFSEANCQGSSTQNQSFQMLLCYELKQNFCAFCSIEWGRT